MRRNIIRLMKKIPIWIKRNLQGIGTFFSIAVPIAYMLINELSVYSVLAVVSLSFGWLLIGADAAIKGKDDIFGMPIPPKRFTSLKGERIIMKKEELHEVALYLYNLEEYLEEAGKTDENKVKK